MRCVPPGRVRVPGTDFVGLNKRPGLAGVDLSLYGAFSVGFRNIFISLKDASLDFNNQYHIIQMKK